MTINTNYVKQLIEQREWEKAQMNTPIGKCDACGQDVFEHHAEIHPGYDGVWHKQCLYPKQINSLKIGYNGYVLGAVEEIDDDFTLVDGRWMLQRDWDKHVE